MVTIQSQLKRAESLPSSDPNSGLGGGRPKHTGATTRVHECAGGARRRRACARQWALAGEECSASAFADAYRIPQRANDIAREGRGSAHARHPHEAAYDASKGPAHASRVDRRVDIALFLRAFERVLKGAGEAPLDLQHQDG